MVKTRRRRDRKQWWCMMQKKIQVPADLEEICGAFEDSSIDHRYYLDFETGEIIFITKDTL